MRVLHLVANNNSTNTKTIEFNEIFAGDFVDIESRELGRLRGEVVDLTDAVMVLKIKTKSRLCLVKETIINYF